MAVAAAAVVVVHAVAAKLRPIDLLPVATVVPNAGCWRRPPCCCRPLRSPIAVPTIDPHLPETFGSVVALPKRTIVLLWQEL